MTVTLDSSFISVQCRLGQSNRVPKLFRHNTNAGYSIVSAISILVQLLMIIICSSNTNPIQLQEGLNLALIRYYYYPSQVVSI